MFRGRSLDYDDLREYVIGDEVRDIDWKATARHGSPLVKRWIAETQTVLFVVDTGRGMPPRPAAATQVGGRDHPGRHARVPRPAPRRPRRPRRETRSTHGYAAQGREGHLERLLRVIQTHTTLASPKSRLHDQLEFVGTHYRQRLLLVVVADEHELPESDVNLVRRLHAQHEILWVTVEDADPTSAGHGDTAVDVGRTSFSPPRCGSTGGCTTRTPRP